MKIFLPILSLLSLSSHALDLEVRLDVCQKKVAKFYAYNGSASDWQKEIRAAVVLKAGESLLDLRSNPIKVFAEDKLVYEGHGSYYSGYFIQALVVNPKSCRIEETFELYSE